MSSGPLPHAHQTDATQVETAGPSTRLLNGDQSAAYVSLSKAHLMRLAREGAVRSYKLGKFRRFAVEDLDQFIEGCREGGGR